MFGEIRRYRGGGEVHMDIMFDGLEVRLPGRSDPITMGVTLSYDFFGGHAVYVESFAQDGYCSNTMRQLTDREVIKHVGDVTDFRTWWEAILAQVELVADDLFEFMHDAQEIEIDFTEMPFSVAEFYELLGFPECLAERAAGDAEANATSPFVIDMWTLHSGASYALTHFFKSKERSVLDGYVRIANDILFNPEGTIERVEQAYEEEVEAGDDCGTQASLDGERGLAQIERVSGMCTQKSSSSRIARRRFASGSKKRWTNADHLEGMTFLTNTLIYAEITDLWIKLLLRKKSTLQIPASPLQFLRRNKGSRPQGKDSETAGFSIFGFTITPSQKGVHAVYVWTHGGYQLARGGDVHSVFMRISETDVDQWQSFFDRHNIPSAVGARDDTVVTDTASSIYYSVYPTPQSFTREWVDGNPVIPLSETVEYMQEYPWNFEPALEMLVDKHDVDIENIDYAPAQ